MVVDAGRPGAASGGHEGKGGDVIGPLGLRSGSARLG